MSIRQLTTACILGSCLTLVTACSGPSEDSADSITADASKSAYDVDGPLIAGVEASDWPYYGRTPSEDHYSPLQQINDKTVSNLKLDWSYDLNTFDSYTSPLAVDGVVYFGVGHSILHAMNGATGELLWVYDPKVADTEEAKVRMRAGWGIRGIAYSDGKLFSGTRDGRLIAVDAKTGELLWSVQTLDEAENGYITGPPWVAGDKVITGFGGADYAPIRGYVTAYDVNTGEQAWRFYTVPGNPADGFENDAMEMAAETWTGDWWKYGGGGTVWNAMAYDPELNLFYIGGGNGWPWNQKIRSPEGGDNLFLSSIIAVDADTGEYVWHYQSDPGNTWDFNNAMDIQLTHLDIKGEQVPALIHAPKNGFFYVIDRRNGSVISAEKYARANWAESIDLETGRPVINEKARYPGGEPAVVYPWPSGAHGPQTMSYNPTLQYAYIPKMDGGRVFIDPDNLDFWEHKPGMMVNTGLGRPPAGIDIPPAQSSLIAWDVANQRKVWEQPLENVINGGTITTGGNLVFQGNNSGKFVAYAADSGEPLWSFDAQNGIMGNAITYEVNGTQYVTVITGFRSSFANVPNWDYRQQQRRVLTFSLSGKADLPPYEYFDFPIAEDPDFEVDAELATIGAGIYNSSCVICHGAGMFAGGAAPDLRTSYIPLNADMFASIVRDGALMERGMPQFGQFNDEQIEGLMHYIRQRAQQTMPTDGND